MHSKRGKYSKNYKGNSYDEEYEEDFNYPEIINITKPTTEVLSTIHGVEAKIKFIPDFLNEEESKELYDYLAKGLEWQQRTGSNQNGEEYKEPRLTYWFGKSYKYSSVEWDENKDWDPKLKELRMSISKLIQKEDERDLNSVMCNYYRDNKDSIGWHADDEISLGRYPTIASISLGCTRMFELCKRNEYYNRRYYPYDNNPIFGGCTILYRCHLNSGSLLIMEGSVQDTWLHRVPKENKNMDGRINLTYRHIISDSEQELEKQRRKENRNRTKSKQQHTNIGECLKDWERYKSRPNNK